MKVAIDSGPLSGGHSWRGIGAHTREMIEALKRLKAKGVEINSFDFNSRSEQLNKYDVLHLTSFNPYFLAIPFRKPASKLVLTIHDLILLIYPKHYVAGIKGKIKFLINRYLINKNVDSIITISETSKKDICRFLEIEQSRVSVVYLAPRKIFKQVFNKQQLAEIKRKYNLPDKFVLYVGDVNYNKNILTLIKACKIVNVPLVVCGKQASEIETRVNINELSGPMDYIRYLFGRPHPEIKHYRELLKYNEDFVRLGFVPDEDLVAVYNLASVYSQPSFYEGFGLPVLEAMASGCPVVASKTQALVEIAGDAAIFANPSSQEDLAQKIDEVLENKTVRNNMVKKGLSVVKKYSWEKSARETLDVYRGL